MNPRAAKDANRCPTCGAQENDRYVPEPVCDCQDCRNDRIQDAMAFDGEFDRYDEGSFERSDRDRYDEDGYDEDDFDADDEDDADDYAEDDDLEDMFEEEDDLDDDDEDDLEEPEDDDLNDFLDHEHDDEDDLYDDFEDGERALPDADDFEDDLRDEGSEDSDYDGFLDDASDVDDSVDEMDRRVLKRPCSGVRRIIVRKNRDGEEPLTNKQEREICAAIRRAREWAANAEGVFDGIWKQRRRRRKRRIDAWEKNKTIETWLGKAKSGKIHQIRATRKRVRRIRDYLQSGLRIVVVQHSEGKRSYLCGGANAYYTGDRRVYLCPNFFNRNADAQARTIIHELVHRLGWAHARLPGFGKVSITSDHVAEAQSLARRFPRRARRNPVNIAWLFSEL